MMATILNTRETVVIYFFWMVFAAMIVTAAINLSGMKLPQKNLSAADGTAPAPSPDAKIAEFQKMLTQNPNNVQALIGLGDVYFDSSRHAEAIETFNKALVLSPSNTHVLNDLGMLFLKTSKMDKALEKFLAALKIEPTHTHSLYYVGLIYRHNGETVKALEAYERLLTLNPPPDMAQKAAQEIEALKSQHGTPE